MNNFIFDVDDTLYDQLIPFEQAYQKKFSNNPKKISVNELYKYSRIYSDRVFEQTQAKTMSMEAMYIYRLTKAFQHVDVPITSKQALDFQKAYEYYQKKIHLSSMMKKILLICAQADGKIGIITNGPATHQRNKIETLGLYEWVKEENVFISGEINKAKPSKQLFDYVANQMNIEPKKTYYIGDSFQNDVLGAKNAGWKSIWLNRRNHVLQETTSPPDYMIETDEQLYKVIKELVHMK